MSELKILCCADLHLGRSSKCLIEPRGFDLSAVGAWHRIVRRAIEDRADAVAIAGDIFDGSGIYYETRAAFAEGLRQLASAGIPAVAVTGNHDYDATARFKQHYDGGNFHLLGLGGSWEAVVLETRSGPATFVGWSFPSERVSLRQFESYTEPAASGPLIGLVHGEVVPGSVYHPFLVSDVDRGADAWVVGHIHGSQRLTARAAYPGSPQALDFGPGERGPHGFLWLTASVGSAEFSGIQSVSSVQFEECELEVSPAEEEDFWAAAASSTDDHLHQHLHSGNPDASFQIRAKVRFNRKPSKAPDGPDWLPGGKHAVQFTDVRVRPAWNLAEIVVGRDAKGELARLLIGAQTLHGDPSDVPPHPDWVEQANAIVEYGLDEVQQQYRRTLGKVSDGGDLASSEPSETEARSIACETLIASLEGMLQRIADREAVAS